MIQFIIIMNILILSLLFTQMKHPLSIGMMLLIQTILISLLIGTMYKNFWFSYILFLVFLGGMLVLFIYVTSLSSNEMFSISSMLMITFMTILWLSLLMSLVLDHSILLTILNIEMESILMVKNFMNENSLTLMKLYTYPTNMITLFLINYLLLTLIISVKITNFFYGPLRPSF